MKNEIILRIVVLAEANEYNESAKKIDSKLDLLIAEVKEASSYKKE